jgi:hypothetical protein
MVATLLSAEASSPELAELLRPERLPNGTEPEERIILCGLSWQRYLALDKALGDDRPGYHLAGPVCQYPLVAASPSPVPGGVESVLRGGSV